jgi:hypothetical protein
MLHEDALYERQAQSPLGPCNQLTDEYDEQLAADNKIELRRLNFEAGAGLTHYDNTAIFAVSQTLRPLANTTSILCCNDPNSALPNAIGAPQGQRAQPPNLQDMRTTWRIRSQRHTQ